MKNRNEGLLDNTLINEIIANNKNILNKYYTIIDCEGKSKINYFYNLISYLNLLEFIKLFLFYDLNNKTTDIDDKLEKKKIQIKKADEIYIKTFENITNLEQSLFETELISNKEEVNL
ncbi:MAG: hypothetical protein ACTTJO_01515 [Metamycoplasmataceae bacterium]|uniref:hypothetical protein n=1 Tax=Mycoplasmopsis lipophila TaxID=2117 RepID=UPI0038738B60